MKIISVLFLCLIFTLTAFGQNAKSIKQLQKEAKTFKHSKYYAAGYDKFKDLSIVSFSGAVIGGKSSLAFGGSIISFGVDFYFKGENLNETPDKLIWKFVSYGTGGWSFLKDRTLYVIADGKRFELPEGLRDSDISRDILGGINTTEILSFEINRDDLQKFANAKTLEIKVGDKPYLLKPEQQQILKDILTISSLSSIKTGN